MPTSAFGVKPPSRAYARVAIGEINDSGDVYEDESTAAHAVAAVVAEVTVPVADRD